MQHFQVRRFLLFALFLFGSFILILGSEFVGARTIYVDDDGGVDHRNIQDAVDDAEEGDTIHVYDGMYPEHIVIPISLTMEGGGSGGTVIDGGGSGCVVTIESQANRVNISGFTITGSGETWLDDCGIKTHSDTNHFFENEITGCRIGIRLHYSDDTKIENNTCIENDYGIYLGFSSGNTISGNNLSGNIHFGLYLANSHENEVKINYCVQSTHVLGVGINLRWSENNTILGNDLRWNQKYGVQLSDGSHNNTIDNNTCIENEHYGIYLRDCDFVLIANNTCDTNTVGIYLSRTSGISIQNNSITNNIEYGIMIHYSTNCELSGNTMIGNGIGIIDGIITYWNSHSISLTNTVNDRPVVYMVNASDESVRSDAGQVMLVNCSNMILLGQNFTECSIGVTAAYCHDVNITNSKFTSNTRSILVYSSNNISISDCSNMDSMIGVYLGKSNDLFMNNVQCYANSYGVYVYSSHDIILGTCLLLGNDDCGCQLSSSVSIQILNCTIENNNDGLILSMSDNNIISGNSISRNSNRGIDLWESSDNLIERNIVHNNEDSGIFLRDYSEGNYVHRNEIYGNNHYGITAQNNVYHSVNATENWWGHASGPYHILNYMAIGDRVTDHVKYDPWMTIPEDYDLPVAVIQSLQPDPGIATEAITFQGMERDERDVGIYEWKTNEVVLYRGQQSSFSADFSSGNYTISFRVMDDLGVWSLEVNITILVHDRPVAEIAVVKNNPVYTTDTVIFLASVIDDGFIVQYFWNSSLDGELYNGTSDQFNVTGLSTGRHLITLRVMDDKGAWSHEEEYVLDVETVDIELPEIIILRPGPYEAVQGIITIRGSVSGDYDIFQVEYRTEDRQKWTDACGYVSGSWSFQLDTRDLNDGYYTVWVRANDGKYYSEPKSVIIIVDNVQDEDTQPPPATKETDYDKYYYVVIAVVLIAAIMINVYASYLEELEREDKQVGEQGITKRIDIQGEEFRNGGTGDDRWTGDEKENRNMDNKSADFNKRP